MNRIKEKLREYEENDYFDPEQIFQIEEGLEANLDVSIYADSRFSHEQMREIKLGLEAVVDVNSYADSFIWEKEMRDIRLGLEKEKQVDEEIEL